MRRRVGWLSALSITGDDGETIGGVIDHRLSRRVVINEFRRGRLRRDQVCDAHPDLMRAARNFGDETQVRCPICQEDNVVLVTYVFGPRLPHHGRCLRVLTNWKNFDNLLNAKRCMHKILTRCIRLMLLRHAGHASGITCCARCLLWSRQLFPNTSPCAENSRDTR